MEYIMMHVVYQIKINAEQAKQTNKQTPSS